MSETQSSGTSIGGAPAAEWWSDACGADEIEPEDVIPVEIDGRAIAVYRSPDGGYFATDGYCTHERRLLADGLVQGCIIECPKHNGRFDYTTGRGKGAPIRIDLETFPVRVVGGVVQVRLP